MSDFKSLGIPEKILNSLTKIGFETPTPIQEKAIPVALEGKDILGTAQTGTGKTAAFVVPLLASLLKDKEAQGLILLPTRELAQQVLDALQKISENLEMRSILLIGGASISNQLQKLRKTQRVFVGTPGRINDFLKRKKLNLEKVKFLVLDETDRMLDMGFGIQLDEIKKYLTEERQTLMFSATLPKQIVKLSQKYLKSPVRIAIGDVVSVATNIKQEILAVQKDKKYDELLNQLNTREGSILVFTKTKRDADKLSEKLLALGHFVDALHGDLKQRQRDRTIRDFRNKKTLVLVATDIAARGLDIPHIRHVINYDLPQCPEDYIHRVGRTARAGADGCAVTFISSNKDKQMWKRIYKMMNPGCSTEESLIEERFENEGPSLKSKKNKKAESQSTTSKDKKSYKGKKQEKKRSFGRNYESASSKKYGNKKSFGKEKEASSSEEGSTFSRKKSFAKDKSFSDKKRFGKAKEGNFFEEGNTFAKKKSFSRDKSFSDKKRFGKAKEGNSFEEGNTFAKKKSFSKDKSFSDKKRFGKAKEGNSFEEGNTFAKKKSFAKDRKFSVKKGFEKNVSKLSGFKRRKAMKKG
ncbi:MAG: DEAD/DEAH box helicase [Alphaproteobacteria bacterium]|nr:DEAD/DEAH box helicase [Alphaproteobacteria bacterium]